MKLGRLSAVGMILALGWACADLRAAEPFTIATYNLENYLDAAAGTRPAKPAEARAKIRESLLAIRPDVVALQEMGSTNALAELREALGREGLHYPHWEHVAGFDTNIHVAVLSRFPIVARRPHTQNSFLLRGRRFHVSRGFAEVDIRVHPGYAFTLMVAHLKSRRIVPEADEAELREQEALQLRQIIDARLTANPHLNLAVLGDFNDTQDSPSTRLILGRGALALTDTRPAERNGDTDPNPQPQFAPRHVTWTHFYGKEDTYGRIDYILLSRGMAREWDPSATYVLRMPNWGTGSDHRPIVAGFNAADR
ncbi:MAG: endonuclease/exonuclease/phosphatase family protein [Verrucomicrobia bacterium]|nr:endonuclease/exonuclease/phosphatase family protein [Verrucomicrobiota bacterium]